MEAEIIKIEKPVRHQKGKRRLGPDVRNPMLDALRKRHGSGRKIYRDRRLRRQKDKRQANRDME